MQVLNSLINPELLKIELGTISLTYTHHAINRWVQKVDSIMINELITKAGQVFEIYKNENQIQKIGVRFPINETQDACLMLKPLDKEFTKFLVITVWVNNQDDNHATLKLKSDLLKTA